MTVQKVPIQRDVPAAPQPRSRRRIAGPPQWVWLGLLACAVGSLFAAVDLYANRGHYVPPLDDTYIHAQYAFQLGHGRFLQYAPGAAPSTGASSFLYMVVLGAAVAAGVPAHLLLPVAVAFGVACLGVTAACTTRLGTLLSGHRCGLWAGLLTAVSGPALWGATSGMEVGLTAALVTGALLAFARELPRTRFVLAPVLGALAALCRPDALVFAAVVSAGMVVATARSRRRLHAKAARAVWLALPIIAGAAQLLAYRAITGDATSDGVAAKSLLHPAQWDPLGFAIDWGKNLAAFARALTGLDDNQFLLPGGLVLAALGCAVLVRRGRAHAGVGWVAAAGLVAVFAALATLSTATWQHLRYLQPYTPLVLLLVVVGVSGFARRAHSANLVRTGVLTAAVLYAATAVPTWAGILGQDSAHTRERVVSLAVWIREHLPPGARVGVHDAGAAAFLSGHPTVDLVGLTTAGLARPAVHGPGSVYEALRDMPPDQRPDYIALYDDLPEGANLIHLSEGGLFSATSPVLGIPELSLYKVDWSLIGSGRLPHSPNTAGASPAGLRDEVNVGSLSSEDAHHYGTDPATPWQQAHTEVRTVEYPDRKEVDSERHIVGGEHFDLRGLTPGRDVRLVLRHDATGGKPGVDTGSRDVVFRVGGTAVGGHQLTPNPRGWNETEFTIPGQLVRSPEVHLSVQPPNPRTGPYPDYHSFHYWAYQ
jgi:hypothetical protein